MTAPSFTPSPVPNRPLTVLDIADGAFSILRARPRTVAGIVACFVLPSQLLASWLQRDLFADLSFDNFDAETGQFTSDSGSSAEFGGIDSLTASPVSTVVTLAILPFIGVALTHLVLGWREGEERSIGECLLFTVRRAHFILVAFVLSKLLQIVSLLFLTPMTMLIAPILAAERVGPITAIRRSFVLGRRRYGALLGLQLLIIAINLLLSSALTVLPTLAAFLLNDWGWVAFFALGSVSAMVLNVLGIGSAVLAYIDLTNRTEGSDLLRRANALRNVDV